MTHTINSSCTGCTSCTKVCPTSAITGERKSQHVIDPGMCIDCGACGRICPFEAVLDAKNEPSQMLKRTLWLQPVVTQSKCVACGACIEVCPNSVLIFNGLLKSDLRQIPALTDAKNCIGCSFCMATCPTQAIHMLIPVKI